MKRSSLIVPAALAAFVFVLPATAGASSWAGTWDTSWGPLTLSGSGGALSGPFGYSDSYNEPLGHVTDAVASGATLTGKWAQDPPSHFAPRDNGTFTLTTKVAADGTVSFDGTVTYAADNTTAEWFGTCKSGACAKDSTVPTATALAASGKAGTIVSLRYRAADNNGKTLEVVTVYRGATAIWSTKTKPHAVRSGVTYQVKYTLPKAKKALRFSVVARDAAGNESRKSYAAIAVK